MSERGPNDAVLKLRAMVTGSMLTAMVAAAAELRLADLLATGAKTADELAAEAGTAPGPTRRLLRALAAHEVFAEREDGRFEQTPLSELLRADTPGSLRNMALMFAGAQARAWLELDHSLRTGGTGFEHAFGKPVFDYFADHPDEGDVFNRAMAENTRVMAQWLVEAHDFSRHETLMDVGGGNGALMIAILHAYPSLRGVVFDLPHVTAVAEKELAAAGLADRCRTVGGSFFDEIPPGADAIIMKAIVHDWDDERASIILRNCHRALPQDGTLLVCDRVMPERVTPSVEAQLATLMDMNMLVNVSGLERTEVEFRSLLSANGFALASMRSMPMGVSVLTAART